MRKYYRGYEGGKGDARRKDYSSFGYSKCIV